ncbi:hypothetical protein Bbelb_204760 [Branchiostoma belcheri]|nr:hypothetical protein Bbelb_204760 [Branchiostoma belcheri]
MEKLWLPPRCVVVLAVLVALARGSDVVRETAYGKVRGKLRDVTTATTGVKQVEVFLGVPYARNPAGTRRHFHTCCAPLFGFIRPKLGVESDIATCTVPHTWSVR